MADALPELRRRALDGLLPWSLPDGDLRLSELALMRQLEFRRRGRGAAYLANVPLPLEPNRVATMREVRTLWLGLGEWLITVPHAAVPELPARLARAIEGQRAQLSDLSASRVVIAIDGERARALLEKGCGLDLHSRSFAPGHCAQTLFAGVPTILDQTGVAAYRLFVRRSLARWLCEWLMDAAQEFRIAG
ncbi:MAG TPA: sarcosine oxidase subunit gamma family protein [Stellaceae bacterium]|nr:sarcosine oxidase subunit gamma family protein [Stellaceae bacterium]